MVSFHHTAQRLLGCLLLAFLVVSAPAQFLGNGPLGPTNGFYYWGTNVTGVQGRGMLNTNFLNAVSKQGDTLSGVYVGAGNSHVTNFTAIASTNGLYSGTAFRVVQFTSSGTGIGSGSGTFINVFGTGSGGITIGGAGVVTRLTGGGGFDVVGNTTNSGFVLTTNGYYAASNSVAAATIESTITEGGGWTGIISNGWHMAWKSNSVVQWKRMTP